MTVTEMLDKLADMQAQLDAIRLHYDDLRASLIPDELKAALADVDAEHFIATEAAQAGISQLTEQIKAAVIADGASVKGAHLHAIWVKGRESWDGKGLAGFAIAHPEILSFRKVGQPSVSIRGVK